MTFVKLLGAAALTASLAFSFAPEADALPIQTPAASQNSLHLVYGGCGPYGHRGPWGGCRRGGQWSGWRRGYWRRW